MSARKNKKQGWLFLYGTAKLGFKKFFPNFFNLKIRPILERWLLRPIFIRYFGTGIVVKMPKDIKDNVGIYVMKGMSDNRINAKSILKVPYSFRFVHTRVVLIEKIIKVLR